MKKLLLISFILSFALVSCESDTTDVNDPSTTIFNGYDKTELDQDLSSSDATTKTFSFTAIEAWSISTEDVTKSSSWITVEPMNGSAGDCEITIKIDENEGEESRSTTITIAGESGGTPIIITITQGGTNSDELCTVTFDTNEGSHIASISVNPGSTIERPDNPTLDGCFFDDWYDSDKLLTRWDFSTPIVEDVTIYAKWSDTETLDISSYDLCIYSKSDLITFRDMVNNEGDNNLKVILMDNIDLIDDSWTPIGISKESPFAGIFEGNGYTINNLYIDNDSGYQGLFGYVMNGTISNLRVKDPNVTGKYPGVVCGYLNDGIIENCSISGGSVSIGDSGYGGAIIGIALNATIVNCCNINGAVFGVVGSSNVGGVVGYVESTTIDDCYNTGSVSSWFNIGGIIGKSETSTITNCYNTGYICGSSTNIGGVVGLASLSSITACYNKGNVSGENSNNINCAGGVIGCVDVTTMASSSVSSTTKYSSNIIACYSTGDVESDDNNGGVVGYIKSISSALNAYTSSSTITITTCYNTGTISGGSDSCIGGIVGNAYAYANALIVNAKTSSSSATSTISINACYNTGTLTGNSDYIGGIVGYDLLTTTSDSESSNVSSDSNSSTSISESSSSEAKAQVASSNCYFLSPTGVSYVNTYGTSSSDLVSTMTSPGIISTLNYRANNDYWKYDTEFTNNGYPVLISVN